MCEGLVSPDSFCESSSSTLTNVNGYETSYEVNIQKRVSVWTGSKGYGGEPFSSFTNNALLTFRKLFVNAHKYLKLTIISFSALYFVVSVLLGKESQYQNSEGIPLSLIS
jgi:hypothetical protein